MTANNPDLNKIQKNVLYLCNRFPRVINDRSALLEHYWMIFDNWDQSKNLYDNLSRSTRPETVLRRLREIREMGLIKESADVEKKNMDAMENEKMRVKDNWRPAAESWLND